MNKEVKEALDEQINFEIYSGFIYLNLSFIMEKYNFKGYAKWLENHYQEELEHASDFYRFIIKRDETPKLLDVKMEEFTDVTTPLEVAKIIYEHERKVSSRIYRLHDLAKRNDDYATEIFMHSYIEEQIEEEDITKTIVDQFTLAGNDVGAQIIVDRGLLG